jgi:signal transduction histidine kinase
VDVPAGVPPVHADPRRLEQVLHNLLDNAAKYSPAGSTIEVAAVLRDGEVVVSVADEGYGIPPHELERLFERYERGRLARRLTAAGAGLGLAIARHIVEAHGGRIWAESPVPGRPPGAHPGAVFYFTLPAGPPAAALGRRRTQNEGRRTNRPLV